MTIPREAVQAIVRKHLGPMKLAVGAVVDHPTDGRVKITSGCYFDRTYGRLSNFWYWTCVDDKGQPVGEEKRGYGWM